MTAVVVVEEEEAGKARVFLAGGPASPPSLPSTSSTCFRPIPGIPETASVCGVACGGGHVVVVASDEGSSSSAAAASLWIFGDWLGKRVATAAPVAFPHGERVEQVAAGGAFAVAVTAAGALFAFGNNACGQLGVGDCTDRAQPTRVSGFSDVAASVACGGRHTLVVDRNGVAWVCGCNAHGQLGLGDKQNRLELCRLDTAEGPVRLACCGDSHSLIAIGDTQLFAFGLGSHCGLGQGSNGSDFFLPQELLSLRRQLEALRESIVGISSGGAYNGALNTVVTSRGKLFLFGRPPRSPKVWSDISAMPSLVTEFDGSTPIVAASCGWLHVAAISADPGSKVAVVSAAGYYSPSLPESSAVAAHSEVNGIEAFLNGIGLGRYAARFLEENITMQTLRQLSDDDFREMDVKIGDRKTLRQALSSSSVAQTSAAAEAPYSLETDPDLRQCLLQDIVVKSKLGEGSFGQVFLANWNGMPVAAKRLKSDTATGAGSREFASEMRIFKQMRHPNCVLFHGFFVAGVDHYLISEYMEAGPLDLYLRVHESLPQSVLLGYALEVASAMKFLASLNVVHRDLAARNVLLSRGGRCAKVSDFGLARCLGDHDYYRAQSARMPIRWCAPECLQYRKFSSRSDVFAFAVLCWEIESKGAIPFGELSNNEVPEVVIEGKRLSKPSGCDAAFFALMQDCWNASPEQRPSFADIHARLTEIVEAVGGGTPPSTSSSAAAASAPHIIFVECVLCQQAKIRECPHGQQSMLEFGCRVVSGQSRPTTSSDGALQSSDLTLDAISEGTHLGVVALPLSGFADRGGLYVFSFKLDHGLATQAQLFPSTITLSFVLSCGWGPNNSLQQLYMLGGAACDRCGLVMKPYEAWFHCHTCTTFDMCPTCYEKHSQEHPHPMARVQAASHRMAPRAFSKESWVVSGSSRTSTILGDPKFGIFVEEASTLLVVEWSHETLHALLQPLASTLRRPAKRTLVSVFSKLLSRS